MKPALFLDQDVHLDVAEGLRRRGYDVIQVQEVGRKGLDDDEQLVYAVESQRCIVTFNVKDFVPLHAMYAERQLEHFGIVVSKQRTVSATFHLCLKLLQTHTKEELLNRLLFL